MEIQMIWKKDPKCLEKIKIGEFPLTLIIELTVKLWNEQWHSTNSTKARQQREMSIGTQLTSFYSV